MPQSMPPLAIGLPDGSTRVLYDPLPHQALYHLSSNIPNVLLGGGRGSGKSLAGRRDAQLRCLAIPGFRALVLRKQMPELRNTHLRFIGKEMAEFGGTYHKTETTAYFPNGSFIKFGHCDTSEVIETYLSAEYDLIFFDELASFTLEEFLQISSSARVTEGCGRIALVRGATNPIGPGAGWIKSWFKDRDVDVREHQNYNPDDFLYIHSTLYDNPHLNQADYIKRLGSQSTHIRKAWMDGEWVTESSYFDEFCPTRKGEPWHCTKQFPSLAGSSNGASSEAGSPAPLIYRAVDWGWYPDPAVCLWIAVYPNARAIVFKERTWTRTTAADVAAEIRRESDGMRVVETFCDPTMFKGSAETGSSVGDIFEQNKVPLRPSKNDRSAAGFAIHEWLGTEMGDELPKLQIYAKGCPNLVKTIPEMQISKSDPSRIADGNDHYVISLAYFCMTTPATPRNAPNNTLPIWMQKRTTTTSVLGSESVRR